MARSVTKRFVITTPEHIAEQVSAICKAGRLNHSDFFCEAAQLYLAAKLREPQYEISTGIDRLMDNPFSAFGEWNSLADDVYNTLR